ncbi:MAG: homoserine kinase [Nitrospirae bacterium]|nr:homoserine kinase [Nitrospirota bacterium]
MVRVFAPASVGNVGPGFDVLGMAITGPGDTVEAEWTDTPGVRIVQITGDDGALPLDANKNTAGIAAREMLKVCGATKGVALRIHKGVPGTGLGSSAASAVAGAFAVNALLDQPLPKEAVLPACIEGERFVSGGVFLDNLAAALYGGVVTCHTGMRTAWRVGTIPGLQVVVVTPAARVLTRESRGALAERIPMHGFVHNMAAACAMVAAVARKDAITFGRAIDDQVVEPQRARLIKGFERVKAAAIGAGALGCSISGAGASVFAVCERPGQAERVGVAMATAFANADMGCTVTLAEMDGEGARVL